MRWEVCLGWGVISPPLGLEIYFGYGTAAREVRLHLNSDTETGARPGEVGGRARRLGVLERSHPCFDAGRGPGSGVGKSGGCASEEPPCETEQIGSRQARGEEPIAQKEEGGGCQDQIQEEEALSPPLGTLPTSR